MDDTTYVENGKLGWSYYTDGRALLDGGQSTLFSYD